MLKLYNYKGQNNRANFGDLLSPPIFERIFSTPTCYAPLAKADVVSIGSVLNMLVIQKTPLHWQLDSIAFLKRAKTPIIIWGSGLIDNKIFNFPLRKFDIRALRGHKTKSIFASQKNITLGDPGLLSNRLLDRSTKKKYRVGIIAHFFDKISPLTNWLDDNSQEGIIKNAIIIDVEREPIGVIKKISECEMILSSSLHGLVVADSLNIPNQWVMFKDTPREGETWKYHDYYSVFDSMPMPKPHILSMDSVEYISQLETHLSQYQRPRLEEIQQELMDSFPFK